MQRKRRCIVKLPAPGGSVECASVGEAAPRALSACAKALCACWPWQVWANCGRWAQRCHRDVAEKIKAPWASQSRKWTCARAHSYSARKPLVWNQHRPDSRLVAVEPALVLSTNTLNHETTDNGKARMYLPFSRQFQHRTWALAGLFIFAFRQGDAHFSVVFGRVAKYQASFLAPAEHAHADRTQLKIAGNKHIANN